MQVTPSFDSWTSMFLLAVPMGLFLFLSIVFTKDKKNLPIGLLMLAFSLILFQYVLYWTRYEVVFPYLQLLPHVCYYTTGPLLYLYFLNLHKKEVKFNFGFHFLPAFLVLVTYLAILTNQLGIIEFRVPWRWFSLNPWFIAIHMGVYSTLIFLQIYRQKTTTQFEKLRARWSKILVGLFVTFTLAYISYYVLVRFPFFNSEWDYMISITMSISIYTIGFFIIKQPQVFDGEFFAELFLPNNNKDTSFEESLMNELYVKLTKHMETEKPFIDNELRLVNLADNLGFSTHLLSKVINKKSGKNFNQFINDYRLQEAKRLLLKNPEYSIKSIYFDVGFNNKATFYNAFKKEFHCTPTQFRDTVITS
ncbi:helix-turn-helix domain-containing protein [Aureisphaera sp. CAU 1614]|uniref:Helix-turn-helix domain-containing protein n=1 Tax=Halomarinibacterium sedimenti TaxID=2857106 RepID=A0A9X1FLH2_9FLAO|nr:helix-turn-helix domain-containing protein [Halomarinibacterium sedimenti]MBW2936681.1 helix-turn-helix domain-containing protein [Halomarinibacterium sedimenti]